MNKELETAKPSTDWISMGNGLHYRWVRLTREAITALRERLQHRCENKSPSNGK